MSSKAGGQELACEGKGGGPSYSLFQMKKGSQEIRGYRPSQRLRGPLDTSSPSFQTVHHIFGAEEMFHHGTRDLALCLNSVTTSCVNLGMSLNLSRPLFPHL